MPGLPIGIPAVPEAITKRIWDFVVQGIADAFKYHDKKDVARRIEALRSSPNLPSLMTDACRRGGSTGSPTATSMPLLPR